MCIFVHVTTAGDVDMVKHGWKGSWPAYIYHTLTYLALDWLTLTLPWSYLGLTLTLPWIYLDLALTLLWPYIISWINYSFYQR